MNGPNEKAQILEALATIFTCYNRKPDAETFKVFGTQLIGIDCDWKQVSQDVVSRFEFMPNLKQIKDIATGASRATQKLHATELVNELETAVGRIGRYNFVRAREELRPELWALVQQIGGWSQACKQDFGAQGTFVRLRDTAELVCTKIQDDQSFIKVVQIEQKQGTNDSRALIASPRVLKSSEGDSSFDVKKALETAFKSKFKAPQSKVVDDIETLKQKAKDDLESLENNHVEKGVEK